MLKSKAYQTAFVSKRECGEAGFPDETFDATVSNFVFHEVRAAADKRDVILEALRVVKKGGHFTFQDMFVHKKLYGDMKAFVEKLKREGFILAFATAPWMLSGVGMIYGRKWRWIS